MKKLLLATVATLALTASGYAADEHGKAGAEMKGQAPAAGTQMKGQAQAPAATGKSEMKGSASNAEKSTTKSSADKSTKSRETTGQGGQGSEMKSTQPEPKANNNTIKNDNGVGEKGARTNERGANERGARSNDNNQRSGERAGDRNERMGEGNKRGDSNRQAGSERSGGSVSLTTEQKTKIRTTVIEKGPRVDRSKVTFNISVGTVVPRSSVHFVAVPAPLIEIYPQWRGYDYFVVGEEIVIIDPRTLKIVAVIEV